MLSRLSCCTSNPSRKRRCVLPSCCRLAELAGGALCPGSWRLSQSCIVQPPGSLLTLTAGVCRRAGRVCQVLCGCCLRHKGLPDKRLLACAVIAGKWIDASRQVCMAVFVQTEGVQHADDCSILCRTEQRPQLAS